MQTAALPHSDRSLLRGAVIFSPQPSQGRVPPRRELSLIFHTITGNPNRANHTKVSGDVVKICTLVGNPKPGSRTYTLAQSLAFSLVEAEDTVVTIDLAEH